MWLGVAVSTCIEPLAVVCVCLCPLPLAPTRVVFACWHREMCDVLDLLHRDMWRQGPGWGCYETSKGQKRWWRPLGNNSRLQAVKGQEGVDEGSYEHRHVLECRDEVGRTPHFLGGC